LDSGPCGRSAAHAQGRACAEARCAQHYQYDKMSAALKTSHRARQVQPPALHSATGQAGPPRDCKADAGRRSGVQHPHPQTGRPAKARAAGRRRRRAGRPGARRRARPRRARPAAAPPAAAARPPAPPRSAAAPRCAARGRPPPAAGTRLDRVRVRDGRGQAAR